MISREWALKAQVYRAQAATVGDEPLIVDLRVPGFSDPSRHGIVLRCDALVTIPATGRAPDVRGTPPNSGVFLCDESTPSESLVEAQAGLVAEARPMALPMDDPYLNVAQVGLGWSIGMRIVGLPMPVPKNGFLRLIVIARQGNATPGPGAGSIGRLRAMVVVEDDIDRSLC